MDGGGLRASSHQSCLHPPPCCWVSFFCLLLCPWDRSSTGFPLPISTLPPLPTCPPPGHGHGQGQHQACTPEHFGVWHGGSSPLPGLAASGHTQWGSDELPSVPTAPGVAHLLWVGAGGGPVEGGDAPLDLLPQAWDITYSSGHQEIRGPNCEPQG